MGESHLKGEGMRAKPTSFLLNWEKRESPLAPMTGDHWKMGGAPNQMKWTGVRAERLLAT